MSQSSSSAIRWCSLGVFLALLTAFGWSVFAPASADAQDTDNPTAALVVSEPAADQPFRTLALTIDAGQVGLAALSGTLEYDPAVITVTSCEVSEAGACNAADEGFVRVSVFNLSGIRDNDRLMTVNFEPSADAAGASLFTFDLDTAVNFQAVDLPAIAVAPLEFELGAASYGSITGDVVAADSLTSLFGIDVCVTQTGTGAETCTTTSGLGTWRLDDMATGPYIVTISDPTGLYATSSIASTVTADVVTTGLEASLGFAADEVVEDTADTDDTGATEPDVVVAPAPAATTPVVAYEASIAGRISAKDSDQSLEGLQVCATQPLVLHQSCGTTDSGGNYGLADLSAGNYWITVVDPLARFEDAPGQLVGVVGDTSLRDNVNIQLDRR